MRSSFCHNAAYVESDRSVTALRSGQISFAVLCVVRRMGRASGLSVTGSYRAQIFMYFLLLTEQNGVLYRIVVLCRGTALSAARTPNSVLCVGQFMSQ